MGYSKFYRIGIQKDASQGIKNIPNAIPNFTY